MGQFIRKPYWKNVKVFGELFFLIFRWWKTNICRWVVLGDLVLKCILSKENCWLSPFIRLKTCNGLNFLVQIPKSLFKSKRHHLKYSTMMAFQKIMWSNAMHKFQCKSVRYDFYLKAVRGRMEPFLFVREVIVKYFLFSGLLRMLCVGNPGNVP